MIRRVAGWLWAALDWLAPRATGRMDIDMTRLTELDQACELTTHSNDDLFTWLENDMKSKETS